MMDLRSKIANVQRNERVRRDCFEIAFQFRVAFLVCNCSAEIRKFAIVVSNLRPIRICIPEFANAQRKCGSKLSLFRMCFPIPSCFPKFQLLNTNVDARYCCFRNSGLHSKFATAQHKCESQPWLFRTSFPNLTLLVKHNWNR